VEDTLLSVVVTNLADSPTAALFRDSGGRVDFLLVASLVAEITGALVTVVSVDAVATFAILLEILSISASMASDIRIITHTTTLFTTTMGIEAPTLLATTDRSRSRLRRLLPSN